MQVNLNVKEKIMIIFLKLINCNTVICLKNILKNNFPIPFIKSTCCKPYKKCVKKVLEILQNSRIDFGYYYIFYIYFAYFIGILSIYWIIFKL